MISDGETNGSTGMKYSLPSRDLIADSIDMMHHGYMADAIVTLCGCDKTVPGALMPIPRSNLIGITLYGGAAQPGHSHDVRDGAGLDAADVMEAIGAYGTKQVRPSPQPAPRQPPVQRADTILPRPRAVQIDIEELHKIECVSLPGTGTCSAMFTANTMASAVEALGMCLPGTAAHPAVVPTTAAMLALNPAKVIDCDQTIGALMAMLKSGLRSRDIMTREAFENSVRVVFAVGGSTNAFLHLLALAHEVLPYSPLPLPPLLT